MTKINYNFLVVVIVVVVAAAVVLFLLSMVAGGSGGSRDGGVLKTKSAKLNELPQPVNLLETIRELFKNCN